MSQNRFFVAFIFLSIICNTVILALDKYPEDDDLVGIFDKVNIGFTIIFFFEMVIKLLGLGIKDYFKDAFNSFDCVVVMTSVVDLLVSNILSTKNGGALNALRTFRLLRIFKLAKSWKRFHDLLRKMGETLKDVSIFSILLYLFVFTYTLIGMELFAFKAKYDEKGNLNLETGTTPQANFDTFLSASTTVFILLTGDNWSGIFYNYYRPKGVVSIIYFISFIIIGQKILLNLFLAILLQNFDEDTISSEVEEKVQMQ